MEVTGQPAKRLVKHAAPIVMIAGAVVAMSVFTGLKQDGSVQSVSLKGLTARVVRIRPNTQGLTSITLDNTAQAAAKPAAGAPLSDHLIRTGSTAQLSLKLGAR